MKVDVLDLEGKKLREVELPAAIFEAPINVDLMHQAYVRQMANARLGTHDTKVREGRSGVNRAPFATRRRAAAAILTLGAAGPVRGCFDPDAG